MPPGPEPYGTYAFRKRLKHLRKVASERRIPFRLSARQVKALFDSPCAYCTRPPGLPVPGSREFRSTIDRIDSTQGYIEGNVVAACLICNRAKNTMTADEYVTWLDETARLRALR